MGDTLPRFQAAVVQAAPCFLDRDATLEKGAHLIQEAAAKGASLIVFPETWIPGYPVWANRLVANREDPRGKALYARLWKNAVEIPSEATEALCRAAKNAGAHVVIGLNERESQFGRSTLYNSLVFIGPDGRILSVHRKLMPTYHERLVWGLGDGSGLMVCGTELGRLGGLICWEHWMPLARYALYTQGEQVHAALWPSIFPQNVLNGEMVQAACRFYAHEGRTFVLSACGWLERSDIPQDGEFGPELEAWPDILLAGGSAIIGPYGDYLAGPAYEGETILYATLDLERLVEARHSLDVTGHYARPDVLRLVLEQAPQHPVEKPGERPPGPAEEHGRLQQPSPETQLSAMELLRRQMVQEWMDLQ